MNKAKDIKDYLHLYLGCECVSTENKPGTKRYILSAITMDGLYEFKTIPEKFSMVLHNWKPLLRPIGGMTDEEKKHLLVNCLNEPYMYASGTFSISKSGYIGISQESGYVNFCTNVTAFHYLLSIGIDLFGLIESGLAIDKTKITNHE